MTRRFAVQAFILGSLLAGCATTGTPAPPAPQAPVGRAGEPIQMNSPSLDPVTFDYLVRVRQMIRGRLTHPPCGNEWWVPWGCTYKSTRVVVQLSILKDGQLHVPADPTGGPGGEDARRIASSHRVPAAAPPLIDRDAAGTIGPEGRRAMEAIEREGVKDASHLYEVERRARHAERPGFRISELQIGPRQQVPWHYHNNIEDTFYVLQGGVRLFLRDPKEEVRLAPGETYTVRARRPHLVTNGGEGSAIFLVLQGIGEYDYVPLT